MRTNFRKRWSILTRAPKSKARRLQSAVAMTTVMALALTITLLPTSASAQAKRGGELVYASGVDAQTLDPQFITDIPTFRVVGSMYEGLTAQNEEGKIIPALATSWTVDDDQRTWTFKLREGVRFHDGSPFNAEAVKFTFDRLMNPDTGSPRRSTLAAVESVDVVDNNTVRIVTKAPYAPLLAQLSTYNAYIMSPEHVKKVGEKVREMPSGTGPFKLKSWQPGERLTVVRNDDYWGEKALLDSVTFTVVPEDSARTLLLLSGQADVISGVPTVMLDRLKKSGTINVIQKPGYRTIYLGMNLARPPFDDIKVRHAVAYAINKEALLKGVLNGIGTLGGSYESSVIAGSATDLPPYPYDPAKAKALLAEAGYPDGFTTDFYVPTGRYTMDRQLGEAIQAQLAEVGIRATIQAPEISSYLSTLSQKRAPLFIGGKGSPSGDMDFTQTLSNGSTGRMNHFNFNNEEVDKLIEQQRVTVDADARREILHKLQTKVYEEAPHITLFYEDQLWATRNNVNDVKIYVNEFVDFSNAWKQ